MVNVRRLPRRVNDYSTVTEVAGELVSREAAAMMRARYEFVACQSAGDRILEVSCGAGQGLGYIARTAGRVIGVDITMVSLLTAHRHYAGRVPLVRSDAQALPFLDRSFDIVAIHEALYYYPDADRALAEAHRVLRPGGRLFISTINPNWSDFNPSPYSTVYFGADALMTALQRHFEQVEVFGSFPAVTRGVKGLALSLLKRAAVALKLIPKTMKGKRLLKRVFFGPLVKVPAELVPSEECTSYEPLTPGSSRAADFKILYAIAHRSTF